MRKQVIIILSILVFLNACTKNPSTIENKGSQVSPEKSLSQHIEKLTDESYSGRRAGTRGDAKAALYLARCFQKAGLKPVGDGGTYFQTFTIGSYDTVMSEGRMTFRQAPGAAKKSENILGLIPGEKEEIVVISAHFDHLGEIGGAIYPGANDNASGVAAILEMIDTMEEEPAYSILFALWGAEEMGLLGSAFFCDKPPVPLEKIKAIINLDSIGNIEDDYKLLGWTSMEGPLSKKLLESLSLKGWQISFENNDKHNSDHYYFNKKGIPGFSLLSPRWLNENHTSGDTPDKIRVKPILKLMDDLKASLTT